MTDQDKTRDALERIRDMSAPGQELGISDAIDLICDIWNIARQALLKDDQTQ